MMRFLLHKLDLARSPFLREERFERAVQTEVVNQPFFGPISIQLPAFTPSGLVGLKYTLVETSALASAAGEG